MGVDDVVSVDALKAYPERLLDEVLSTHEPKVIVYENRPALALVDLKEYKRQLTRLAMLEKTGRGLASTRNDELISHADVSAEVRKLFPGIGSLD